MCRSLDQIHPGPLIDDDRLSRVIETSRFTAEVIHDGSPVDDGGIVHDDMIGANVIAEVANVHEHEE